MKKIRGFPGYTYENGIVYKASGDIQKLLVGNRGNEFYKMKNYESKWVALYKSKLLSIVGESLKLPVDAMELNDFPGYYIDKNGVVYSFSVSYPNGKILSHTMGTNGYLQVKIKKKTKEVHQLIADTFITKGYVKKGLCVLHRDNDKTNNTLDNICVGTYSRNNKQAYKDGANPGNGLKATQAQDQL